MLAGEVPGGIDPVAGDRAADLGGDRPAAQVPQETDRQVLELKMGGGFQFERSVRPSGPTLAFVRPAEFIGWLSVPFDIRASGL